MAPFALQSQDYPHDGHLHHPHEVKGKLHDDEHSLADQSERERVSTALGRTADPPVGRRHQGWHHAVLSCIPLPAPELVVRHCRRTSMKAPSDAQGRSIAAISFIARRFDKRIDRCQ